MPECLRACLHVAERATYFKSFSIRSTWVMIIRRQQYRFRPSSSMASLVTYVNKLHFGRLLAMSPYPSVFLGSAISVR